jgi:hypothetical protein
MMPAQILRWSATAAIAGGILFPVGIALHPLRHGEAVVASAYSAIHLLIGLGLFLVLFGVVGIYAHIGDRLGRIGRYGFAFAFAGNVWTYGLIVTEGFLWPAVGQYDVAAVHNFDHGSLLFIFFVGLALFGIGYAMLGGAIAQLRWGPRWAGVSVAFGSLIYVFGAFSLPALGPESVVVTIIETAGAIPFGLGFVRLGVLLRSVHAR